MQFNPWKSVALILAARDRCGDAADRIRCVRTPDFNYIRNFHPDRPYPQHSGYKKLAYPVLTVMKVLHEQRRWDTLFMSETRPEEELYDIDSDRTIPFNSMRAGCTTSLIPAPGVLSAPMLGHGCVCNYPMFASVALYQLPGSESWRPKAVQQSWDTD